MCDCLFLLPFLFTVHNHKRPNKDYTSQQKYQHTLLTHQDSCGLACGHDTAVAL